MKKVFWIFSGFLLAGTVFAGGVDLEFFGCKVCNIGFDVNPFSRDDGRNPKVYVPVHAPQYYTPPPLKYNTTKTCSIKSCKKESGIVIKDSSNVTIINQEQISRPVYTTYQPIRYYSIPVTYSCPVYYYSGYYPYYYRPYYWGRYW